MRTLLGCIAALGVCWLVVDLLRGRGADVVAEVEGVAISKQELQEALRAHFWARGQSWQDLEAEARRRARLDVLESLINDRLVRVWRLREGGQGDAGGSSREELAMLRRQFTDAGEYERRLASQQHDQKSLGETVHNAQLDEAWIRDQMRGPDPDEARLWYDQHKETLRIPQAHHAFQIFLTRHDAAKPDREAEIRRIHHRLAAREGTFAALAKKHSEDDRTKNLGGDLGWFTRERMPTDFVAAVEKLRVGEVGAPVQTALGWHLIWLLERQPSRLPTFEECRHEIAAALDARRRERALGTLLADLRQRSSPRIAYHQAVIDGVEPAP